MADLSNIDDINNVMDSQEESVQIPEVDTTIQPATITVPDVQQFDATELKAAPMRKPVDGSYGFDRDKIRQNILDMDVADHDNTQAEVNMNAWLALRAGIDPRKSSFKSMLKHYTGSDEEYSMERSLTMIKGMINGKHPNPEAQAGRQSYSDWNAMDDEERLKASIQDVSGDIDDSFWDALKQSTLDIVGKDGITGDFLKMSPIEREEFINNLPEEKKQELVAIEGRRRLEESPEHVFMLMKMKGENGKPLVRPEKEKIMQRMYLKAQFDHEEFAKFSPSEKALFFPFMNALNPKVKAGLLKESGHAAIYGTERAGKAFQKTFEKLYEVGFDYENPEHVYNFAKDFHKDTGLYILDNPREEVKGRFREALIDKMMAGYEPGAKKEDFAFDKNVQKKFTNLRKSAETRADYIMKNFEVYLTSGRQYEQRDNMDIVFRSLSQKRFEERAMISEGGAFVSAAEMAPDFAFAAAASSVNPVLGLSYMFGRDWGERMDDLQRSGVTLEDALVQGTITSGIYSAIEYTQMRQLGAMGDDALKALLLKRTGKAVSGKYGQRLASFIAFSQRYGSDFLQRFAVEAGEEVAQSFIDFAGKAWAKENDGGDYSYHENMEQVVEEVKKMVGGMAVLSFFGTGGRMVRDIKDQGFNGLYDVDLYNAITDPKKVNEIKGLEAEQEQLWNDTKDMFGSEDAFIDFYNATSPEAEAAVIEGLQHQGVDIDLETAMDAKEVALNETRENAEKMITLMSQLNQEVSDLETNPMVWMDQFQLDIGENATIQDTSAETGKRTFKIVGKDDVNPFEAEVEVVENMADIDVKGTPEQMADLKRANGMYLNGKIYIREDANEDVLTHELLHAMKDLGVLEEAEYTTLIDTAKQVLGEDVVADIDKNYSEKNREEEYVARLVQIAKQKGVPETLQKNGIWEKIKQWIRDLIDSITGNKQMSKEAEVLQDIISGKPLSRQADSGMRMSVPSGKDAYKDRDGEQQGEPITEQEFLEGIEDESGTTYEPEVDDDAFSDKKSDIPPPKYSLASDVPMINRKDLAGKEKFIYFSDRTRVGVYKGLNNDLEIDLQGGMMYPYMDGHGDANAGWAFTDPNMWIRFNKRVNNTDGVGVIALYSKENLRANPTFAYTYFREVESAINAGQLEESLFLEEINKLRETANKTKKFKPESEWAALFLEEWTSIQQAEEALQATTFENRGNNFFQYNANKKGENKGSKIGADKLIEKGFPNVSKMVDMFAEPGLEGMPNGTLVGAVEFEKNQEAPVTADDIGAEDHRSYPVVIKGKGLGLFNDPISLLEIKEKTGVASKEGKQALRSAEVRMADLKFSLADNATQEFRSQIEEKVYDTTPGYRNKEFTRVEEPTSYISSDFPFVVHGIPFKINITRYAWDFREGLSKHTGYDPSKNFEVAFYMKPGKFSDMETFNEQRESFATLHEAIDYATVSFQKINEIPADTLARHEDDMIDHAQSGNTGMVRGQIFILDDKEQPKPVDFMGTYKQFRRSFEKQRGNPDIKFSLTPERAATVRIAERIVNSKKGKISSASIKNIMEIYGVEPDQQQELIDKAYQLAHALEEEPPEDLKRALRRMEAQQNYDEAVSQTRAKHKTFGQHLEQAKQARKKREKEKRRTAQKNIAIEDIKEYVDIAQQVMEAESFTAAEVVERITDRVKQPFIEATQPTTEELQALEEYELEMQDRAVREEMRQTVIAEIKENGGIAIDDDVQSAIDQHGKFKGKHNWYRKSFINEEGGGIGWDVMLENLNNSPEVPSPNVSDVYGLIDWLYDQTKPNKDKKPKKPSQVKRKLDNDKYLGTLQNVMSRVASELVNTLSAGNRKAVLKQQVRELSNSDTLREETIKKKFADIVAKINSSRTKASAKDLKEKLNKLINRSVKLAVDKEVVRPKTRKNPETGEKEPTSIHPLTVRYLKLVKRILNDSSKKQEERIATMTRYLNHPDTFTDKSENGQKLVIENTIDDLLKGGYATDVLDGSIDHSYENKAKILLKAYTIYSGTNKMTPAELEDLINHTTDIINGSQATIEKEWEDFRQLAKDLRDGVLPAITGTAKAGDVEQFLSTLSGGVMSHKGFYDLMIAGSTGEQRAEAVEALDKIRVKVARATHDRKIKIFERQVEFLEAISEIYEVPVDALGTDAVSILSKLSDPKKEYGKHSRQGNKKLSKLQLMQILGFIQQEDYQENAQIHNRDAGAILAELDAKDLKLVQWFKDDYAKQRERLEEVTMKILGLPVEMSDPNYLSMMIDYMGHGLQGNVSVPTIVPPSVKNRVNHTEDVDEDYNIFDAWRQRLDETEHFIAGAETMQLLREVFGHRDMKIALKDRMGKRASGMFQTGITSWINNGYSSDMKFEFLDLIRSWFTYTKFAFNARIGLKQPTSLLAYGFDIGLTTAASHLMTAFTPEGIEAMKEIYEHPLRKDRSAGGMTEGIRHALSLKPDKVRSLFKHAMIFNAWGDIVPTLLIGQGIYRAYYNENMNIGMNEAEAKADAMSKLFMHAEATQQSGELKDQAYYQIAGGSPGRALAQFTSTTRQFLERDLTAAHRVAKNPKDIDAWKNAGEVGLINHIILPGAYNLVNLLINLLLGQEPDEDDLRLFIASLILGPASGYIVLGSIVVGIGQTLATGKKPWHSSGFTPLTGIKDDAMTVGELITSEDMDEAVKQVNKLLKSNVAPYREISKGYKNYK